MTTKQRPIRAGVVPVEHWSPSDSDDESFTYLDISSIDRETKSIVWPITVPVLKAPSRARQLVKEGDVLVSTVRPGLNAVALVPAVHNGAIASTGFVVLRARCDELDSRFLYYWVRTPAFVTEMLRNATGASYPAISERIVLDSIMPAPSLRVQQDVADTLDKADAIRRKRKAAIALIDDLLRSVFLDMFGDPVTNPKGWPVVSLETHADIRSGVAKGKRYEGEELVTRPYMRVANVQDGYLRLDEVKHIQVSIQESESYRLAVGDVLLTEGGDPDKLGRGAVWRGEVDACIHQNHVFRVRVGKCLVPEFASAQLGSDRGKRYFLRAAKQTTGIASINMGQLREFPLLLPPLSLQQHFAAAAGKARALATRLHGALAAEDDLFSSLSRTAFAT